RHPTVHHRDGSAELHRPSRWRSRTRRSRLRRFNRPVSGSVRACVSEVANARSIARRSDPRRDADGDVLTAAREDDHELLAAVPRRDVVGAYGVAQDPGEPYSLAYGDLDHFKALNDTHGHHAGDQALRPDPRADR